MPETKSIQHQVAAYHSWAQTEDWTQRTSKARKAFEEKFLTEHDGDPKRAAAARKAFFRELAKKSAEARARRKAGVA